MREIQKKVNNMIKKYDLNNSIEMRFIDLVSEVGELGKEILKSNDYGKIEFSKTENIKSEIGDVLFSVAYIANELDIDLKDTLDEVIAKYDSRFLEKGNIESGR